MIQRRSGEKLETVNIDSYFEEFCCHMEKTNGTEAGGSVVVGMWGKCRT